MEIVSVIKQIINETYKTVFVIVFLKTDKMLMYNWYQMQILENKHFCA